MVELSSHEFKKVVGGHPVLLGAAAIAGAVIGGKYGKKAWKALEEFFKKD
ncbi:hypothetical protein [Ferrimonas sp. YFM]|nr:hypothetical protein [Ferrimonas sp. YFM]